MLLIQVVASWIPLSWTWLRLGGGQGIGLAQVVVGVVDADGVVEAEDVALRDAIDALCRREAVDLHLEDVAQSLLIVGEGLLQALAVVEAAHNLRDILA